MATISKFNIAPPERPSSAPTTGRVSDQAREAVDKARDAALNAAKRTEDAAQAAIKSRLPKPPQAIPLLKSKPGETKSEDKEQETAYPHNEGANVQASGAEEITIDFQPNLLDNYDTYTYHYKLFITSLENAAEGSVLEIRNQTIIVESGVTDLTIDNLELQGIAVPSLEAGTGTQTLLKFQIQEPGGAGLLDKLYYESVSLGIGNWLVMPCFLQLEFRGRDPSTSETVTGGEPDTLGGLKWVWPIKITNCKAFVSSSGTKYDFDAIFYDELAQSNSYFAIQHNVVLNELDNFKKAMDDLEDKLNQDQYEKLIDNYSIPDTYRVVVDQELANVKIALPEMNRHTSRAGDYINFDTKTATYNPGTGIDKIVDSLLGTSDFFQKNLQSAPTRTGEPESANQANPMRNLWRIITETRPIAFDSLRQDNAVEITIYIVKYNIGLIDATPAQTGQTPDTLIAARKRLATYNNTGILRKKYNYIFTGLNDQVINFDLNMNFSFAATLSRFGGIFLDTANSDKGVVKPENTLEDERAAAERVRRALQFINDPKNKDGVEAEIAGAKASLDNTKISAESRERYNKILAYAKKEDRIQRVKDIKTAGGVTATGDLNQRTREAKSLAGPPSSTPKFISDVDSGSEDAKQARKDADDSRKGKLRPVPYREGTQEVNLAYGIDPYSDAGRARTSNLFSTALYSTLDASLVQVKITIKGDPFWLYPRNQSENNFLIYRSTLDPQAAIQLIKAGHKTDKSTVNPMGTDNFIVIRFRTPKMYNDETGLIDAYSEVETFSGIYRVILITSKFENGKFTQELTCLLDDLINLSDFPDFIRRLENEFKTPDPVVASNNPVTKIVSTGIKTDKITGIADQVKGQVATIRDAAGNVIDTATSVVGGVGLKIKNVTSNIPADTGFTATQQLLRKIPGQ